MSRDHSPKAVGYKSPPQHTRFQKGQSGNPSGRRKAKPRPNLIEELDKVLSEPIIVTRNGKAKPMSRLAAVLHKLTESALKNDTRAMGILFKLMSEYPFASDQQEHKPTNEQDQALIAAALARIQLVGGDDA